MWLGARHSGDRALVETVRHVVGLVVLDAEAVDVHATEIRVEHQPPKAAEAVGRGRGLVESMALRSAREWESL